MNGDWSRDRRRTTGAPLSERRSAAMSSFAEDAEDVVRARRSLLQLERAFLAPDKSRRSQVGAV
eukprot:1979177-Pyramimonas_sp.AAC.1